MHGEGLKDPESRASLPACRRRLIVTLVRGLVRRYEHGVRLKPSRSPIPVSVRLVAYMRRRPGLLHAPCNCSRFGCKLASYSFMSVRPCPTRQSRLRPWVRRCSRRRWAWAPSRSTPSARIGGAHRGCRASYGGPRRRSRAARGRGRPSRAHGAPRGALRRIHRPRRRERGLTYGVSGVDPFSRTPRYWAGDDYRIVITPPRMLCFSAPVPERCRSPVIPRRGGAAWSSPVVRGTSPGRAALE